MELSDTDVTLVQALAERRERIANEANEALAGVAKAFDALLEDCVKKYKLDPKKKWRFVGGGGGISIVEDTTDDEVKELPETEN